MVLCEAEASAASSSRQALVLGSTNFLQMHPQDPAGNLNSHPLRSAFVTRCSSCSLTPGLSFGSTGHTEASEQAPGSSAHTRAKQELQKEPKSSGLHSAVSNAVTCLFNTTKTCLKQGTPATIQTLSLYAPLDQYFMHFTESQGEKLAKAWNKGS